MDIRGDNRILVKSVLLLFVVVFSLMFSVGGVLAADLDCSTLSEGASCGTCYQWGCFISVGTNVDSFWQTLDYWTSGEKTCQNGDCSASTCVYDHVCADTDLFDNFPNVPGIGSVVACSAQCDGDEDCPNYCEAEIFYDSGNCDKSIGCSCVYESQDCDALDGWYCDASNGREERDYSCGVGGCSFIVTSSEDCSTVDNSYCDGDQIMYTGGFCNDQSGENTAVCDSGIKEGENCYFYELSCLGETDEIWYEEGFCDDAGEVAICDFNTDFMDNCNEDYTFCSDNSIIDHDEYCSGGACSYDETEITNCYNLNPYCDGDSIWYEEWGCSESELIDPHCEATTYFNKNCNDYDFTIHVTDVCEINSGDIFSWWEDWTCDLGKCAYSQSDSQNGMVDDCINSCEDSDLGIDFFVSGTTLDKDLCTDLEGSCPSSEDSDYCVEGDILREFYCNLNDMAYQDKDCDSYDCENPETWTCNGVGTNTLEELGKDYICGTGACRLRQEDATCDGPWNCGEGNECALRECGDDTYTCHQGAWVTDVQTPEICDDGLDNDCNGLIDCADPACGDLTPPETVKRYSDPQYSGGLENYEESFSVDIEGSDYNLEVTVEDDGDWMVWTFDFPVEQFTGEGNLNVGLIIATDGEGEGPAYQIHNTDSDTMTYDGSTLIPAGTWVMSPWGPTIGDGWNGWHSGDTNTPVTSLSWVETTGNRNVPHGGGILQVKILKSELGNSFHWAASPTVGSGFYAPVYDVSMQIPTAFGWSTPLVDMTVPNYIYAGSEYPLWITSETPIYLEANDPQGPVGECVSGLDKTFYYVTLVDDEYCWDKMLDCQNAPGFEGDFLTYEDIINIPKDSCHLIEYYSIDNRGTPEPIKKQCVFVDNEGPIPNKTVEEVKTKWLPNAADDDYEISYFYPDETAHCWDGTEDSIDCWKVTLDTPINMECIDPAPHPVGFEELCFNVDWDGEDITDTQYGESMSYCDSAKGYMNDGEYCCVPYNVTNFYFKEESEHNLEYYCVDKLGNIGPIDDEKFKVFGRMHPIELEKKWNLISVPFDPIDKAPEAVFNGIKEDVDSVWSYDTEIQQWQVYRPNGNPLTNNLEKIESGLGYWVMALEETDLIIGGSLFSPGPISPPSRRVIRGWNLIGYYGTEGPQEAICSLSSLVDTQIGYPRWSSLWSYEPNSQQFLPISYEGLMDTDEGYWLEIDVEDYYAPSSNCEILIT